MPVNTIQQQQTLQLAIKKKRKEFADLYKLPRRRFAALVVCGVRYGVKFGDFHTMEHMLAALAARQGIKII